MEEHKKNLLAFTILIIVIAMICVIVHSGKKFPIINFDSIYFFVINLERSRNRKIQCIEEFQKYKITNYVFVKGIDGGNYTEKEEMLKKNNYSTNFCINGTKHIGCYISHLRAIRFFYESHCKIGVILEDDFIFKDDPRKYIRFFSSFFSDQDDQNIQKMINLAGSTIVDNTPVTEKITIPTWNAVGYAINKKAASIMLENLSPDSVFLNTHYKKTDCLYDFALFKLMKEKLKWKWITLVGQRLQLVSTITNEVRQ